ncbi:pyridoxine 5'-phosphate synthase [Leptospira ryugenii]|uniref:Pyridoxine 5'-phosphate synthase n=1 Tax=Leptospira ryugenii TaxID=1917863 RepID=A0A2P2E0A6_9LEPT|nr:pyridoxine 5'-phosphate synthase [Leptospira ryugenii]GBF50309.1 pyridoxine 5'-phosphate synthase [Leptospira ryugenii]
MTQLSVNVNKIATLRNSRGGGIPNVISFCQLILDLGAHGITIHPREDERHITKKDVFEIASFLKQYNTNRTEKKELNIEGEPSKRFMELVLAVEPDQATLVPVTPGEITSDHGFNLFHPGERDLVAECTQALKQKSIRVSLFMESDPQGYEIAKDLGADRIELYTGPFAHACDQSLESGKVFFKEYETAAKRANELGLGVNAGHDLDTNNLQIFAKLPHLAEVSIGHRLMAQALRDGMKQTIEDYLKVLSQGH